MKKEAIKHFHLITLIALLYSCNITSDEIISEAGQEDLIVTSEIQDELSYQFAKIFASRIRDYVVRDIIKNKALEKFDGDYNILFTELMESKIESKIGEDSGSFKQLLIENPNTVNSRVSKSYDGLVDSLQKLYPLMQISIPSLQFDSADSWDIESHIPLVAVLDSKYDDQKTQHITAFDQFGDKHLIDGLAEPEELVIVISESERVGIIDKSSQNKESDGCDEYLYEDEIYRYFLKGNCYNITRNIQEIKDIPSNGRTLASCRSYGKYEYLFEINCKNNCGESWARGAPELHLELVSGLGYKVRDEFTEPPKRKQIMENNWFRKDVRLFQWSESLTGEVMVWIWWEEDGGNYDEYTNVYLPLIGEYYKVRYHNKDDYLDDTALHMDDCRLSDDYPAGHIYQNWQYESGAVRWKVKIWSN